MTRKPLAYRLAFAAVIAASFLTASAADAGRNPEDVFAGQIVTSRKRQPATAKSAGDYIAKLKKGKSDTFIEDKEKKEWNVHFTAFFRRPLNDLEVTVKFYDITSGQKRMVAAFEQFLDGRGQRTVRSKAILERSNFGVNKHIYMTVENRGRVLASTKFKIIGEAEKFSGKVDFTEDEAK